MISSNRKQNFFDTIIFFLRAQFILNILKGILIAMTTAIGLYIFRLGWEKSNKSVIHLGFIFTGIITCIQVITAGFNIDQNVHTNKQLIKAHNKLESDILLYMITEETNFNVKSDIKEYCRFIDKELALLYTISVSLDDVPVDDYGISQFKEQSEK